MIENGPKTLTYIPVRPYSVQKRDFQSRFHSYPKTIGCTRSLRLARFASTTCVVHNDRYRTHSTIRKHVAQFVVGSLDLRSLERYQHRTCCFEEISTHCCTNVNPFFICFSTSSFVFCRLLIFLSQTTTFIPVSANNFAVAEIIHVS